LLALSQGEGKEPKGKELRLKTWDGISSGQEAYLQNGHVLSYVSCMHFFSLGFIYLQRPRN
jgi:hypothetical protein